MNQKRSRESLEREIVLVCDATGQILEMLRNDTDLDVPPRFLECLAEPCREKARQFITRAWTEREATGWELLLATEPPQEMRFAAFRRENELVVVGATSDSGMMRTLESLSEISSALVTRLREEIKARKRVQSEGNYDRFSSLNNELANAHRDLAKQSQELRRLNAEKDRLLAMVTHDVRSPLTIVLNYARLLDHDLDPEEKALALSEVVEATQFVLRLVDDLLDVSAIDAGKLRVEMRPTDPAAETRLCVRRLQPLARDRDVHLEFATDENVGELLLDRLRYRQIIENLIINAIKFSPPDGVILTRLRRLENGVELSVADEGPGISVEDQERLFEPFQRLSGDEPGAGLGLAIVKQLVRLHGGDVGIESEPGQGATFTATFPRGETVNPDESRTQ